MFNHVNHFRPFFHSTYLASLVLHVLLIPIQALIVKWLAVLLSKAKLTYVRSLELTAIVVVIVEVIYLIGIYLPIPFTGTSYFMFLIPLIVFSCLALIPGIFIYGVYIKKEGDIPIGLLLGAAVTILSRLVIAVLMTIGVHVLSLGTGNM